MVSETTPMVLAEGHHTMALDQSALLELLDALKAADVDERIRSAATTIYQALIEAELSSVIGAAPHERTETRVVQRNGHRPKTVSTVAGDLELQIPKLAICGVKSWVWACGIGGGLGARRWLQRVAEMTRVSVVLP